MIRTGAAVLLATASLVLIGLAVGSAQPTVRADPPASSPECTWMLETLALDQRLDLEAVVAARSAIGNGKPDQLGRTGTAAADDVRQWMLSADWWGQALQQASVLCGQPAPAGMTLPACATVIDWFQTAGQIHDQWARRSDQSAADRAWNQQWVQNYSRLGADFAVMCPTKAA